MCLKLISWNVNGIRAVEKKGFIDWVAKADPDILCVQETKANKDQLSDNLLNIAGYKSYWGEAEKKGYSGTAVFSKIKPINIFYGFGKNFIDSEGRVVVSEFEKFFLLNIYFPNGQRSKERLDFKYSFYDSFLKYTKKLMAKNKVVIVCGDVNTAHTELDIARPKENENRSGFLREERAWLDKFERSGLVDTFRYFEPDGGHYTWWDYKTRARERNIGWRIDYFYITKKHLPFLNSAFILDNIMGSDHCPIGIEINLKNFK